MLNLGLYKLHSNFDADSVMRWPDPRGGKTRQLNMRPGFIMFINYEFSNLSILAKL